MQIVEYNLEKPNKLVKFCSYQYPNTTFSTADTIMKMLNKVFRLGFCAEEFVYVMGFTTTMELLGVFNVAHGTVSQALISAREIMIRLLLTGASCFIVIHNHPSGQLNASVEDSKIAQNLKSAGELIGLPLLDFIVISDNDYMSFKEQGCM